MTTSSGDSKPADSSGLSRISTVLVGTDGSDDSLQGVSFAASLARQLDARVIVVHAMTLLEHLPGRPVTTPHEIRDELEGLLNGEWSEPLAAAGVPHECVFDDGPPLLVLPRVAAAHDVDLIVVASHGRGNAALALGSTSHGLLQIADCPVTVIPTRTEVRPTAG